AWPAGNLRDPAQAGPAGDAQKQTDLAGLALFVTQRRARVRMSCIGTARRSDVTLLGKARTRESNNRVPVQNYDPSQGILVIHGYCGPVSADRDPVPGRCAGHFRQAAKRRDRELWLVLHSGSGLVLFCYRLSCAQSLWQLEARSG